MSAVWTTVSSCFLILFILLVEHYCILLDAALETANTQSNGLNRTSNQEWPALGRRTHSGSSNFQNSYAPSHTNTYNSADSSRINNRDWPVPGERRHQSQNNHHNQNSNHAQNNLYSQSNNNNQQNSFVQSQIERWNSRLNQNNSYASSVSNRPHNNNNFNVRTQQTHFATTRRTFTGIQFGNSDRTDEEISADKRANTFQVADNELREFSEGLLLKDANNAAKYVRINFQGRTTSRSRVDEAPQALLSVSKEVYNIPTIAKLQPLYDNYVVESSVNEDYTNQERQEENAFLKAVLNTEVMKEAKKFLINKGAISGNEREFEDLLYEMWFHMYPRAKRKLGSSAFEHVFLAEIKRNEVSGLHNWLYFDREESSHRANYLGYLKKIDLGNKGAILKYNFDYHGINKPVGSMFIGTSPEFEMALYSTCFILRADRVCPLKLNGHRFVIRTYTFRYDGKNLIGSAFPEI